VVNGHDSVSGKVNNLLKIFWSHVQKVTKAGRNTLEVPDVSHGSGKLDVTHALTTNGGLGNFYSTTLTNNSLEANALVLSTRAFPVLGRTEDLLAEQTVLLRLESSVVDGLRLLNFTV
jgi:hypothetical protein